jgi:hypothetical protein
LNVYLQTPAACLQGLQFHQQAQHFEYDQRQAKAIIDRTASLRIYKVFEKLLSMIQSTLVLAIFEALAAC